MITVFGLQISLSSFFWGLVALFILYLINDIINRFKERQSSSRRLFLLFILVLLGLAITYFQNATFSSISTPPKDQNDQNINSTTINQTTQQGEGIKEGKVTVYYYKDGSYYDSETKKISSSQYISPIAFIGYTCNTESQYVIFDSSTGKCTPSSVRFDYSSNTPAPTPIYTQPPQVSVDIMTKSPKATNKLIYKNDEIYFGKYEQDGNEQNGKEPIAWIVVDVDQYTALVVSKYILDCQIYNDTTNTTNWADTKLNIWLQNTFVPEAFSSTEQSFIVTNRVSGSWNGVFIFDIKQMEKYFPNQPKDYLCEPTKYAIKRGVDNKFIEGKTCCSYWLRINKSSTYGTFVGIHGGVYDHGNQVTITNNGVRPAMYIMRDGI